ncbi:MAG: hypothetical protein ACYTG0_06035 [Planctomycetota bacterium]|jgi:hypothetical protein
MSNQLSSSQASRHLAKIAWAVRDLLKLLRAGHWNDIPGTRRHVDGAREARKVLNELSLLLHPKYIDKYRDAWAPETRSAVNRAQRTIRGLIRVNDDVEAAHLIEHCASFLGAVQPVVLRGRKSRPIVLGKEKRVLTRARYDVVKALIDAGPHGLTKDLLDDKSGHTDARKILGALAKSDEDWGKVVHMPGQPGRRYRISDGTE